MKTAWTLCALSLAAVLFVGASPSTAQDAATSKSPPEGSAADNKSLGKQQLDTKGEVGKPAPEKPALGGPDKPEGKVADKAGGADKSPDKGADKGSAGVEKQKGLTPAETAAAAATKAHGPADAAIWVKGPDRSNDKPDRIEFALGDYVILGLKDSLESYTKDDKVNNKFGLYINDLYFKDIPALAVPGRDKAVMFHLKRTDDNRDSWSVLFSRKRFSLGSRSDSCVNDQIDGVILAAGYPDGSKVSDAASACLEYFPDKLAATGLLLLAAAIGISTLYLSLKSSMIRDVGIPPAGKLGTYSLARFQMALWFVTIVFGFLWAYAVTGDMSPIPDGALILMGIGAGTAVGAAAIDITSTPGSKEDYLAAKNLQLTLDAKVTQAQIQLTTLKAAGASDAKLAEAQNSIDAAVKAAADNATKVKSFGVPASKHFIWDILSDGNGIAFHRLQVFGWTMVYWSMFVIALWHKITMIDFTTSQLALMGISGVTYLGFKLQEQPKQTNQNQPGPGQSPQTVPSSG